MPWFGLALVVYDVVGLAAGAWLLWKLPVESRRLWVRDVGVFALLAACLVAAAFAVSTPFVLHRAFGILRLLAHGMFCVAAPLMLVRGIWHLRRGIRAFGGALLAMALLMETAYVYARRVEPYRLEVTRHEVELPQLAGEEPIVVVVVADLQTDRIGEYEQRVFAAIDAQRADLILLPGDYLQIHGTAEDWSRERRALAQLLNGLEHRPRYGVWGVDGDTDQAAPAFRGTPARPLRDEVEILPGEPPVQLVGLSLPRSRRPLSTRQLERIASFEGLTIVLGHSPAFAAEQVRAFEASGAGAVSASALCIAGHTHGGQVVIPGFGPPITLSPLPRRYASGLHRLGAMTLFVSRGIGMERGLAPRIRFNCRPELAVLTLRGP